MSVSASHEGRDGKSPSTIKTLIHPLIAKVAEALRTGTLTPDQMQRPTTLTWPRAIPSELLPFLESGDLNRLAEMLKEHPSLYWHPVVMSQLKYLARLRHDDQEWHRLGWTTEYDKKLDVERPPKEVALVREFLQKLLAAHAAWLFPGSCIKWEPARQKSGPKAGLTNPHPSGPWAERVSPEWLADDFCSLRDALRARLENQTGKPHFKTEVKEWYRKLAQEVFEEAAESESVAWWSDWKDYSVVERDVEPVEPSRPHAGDTSPEPAGSDLLNTYDSAFVERTGLSTIDARIVEETEERIRFLDGPITSDLLVRWKPLDLDKALSAMLNRENRTIREGVPSYLAYAILGALLGVKPEKIRNMLDNYVRPRRRRTK